MAPELQGLAFWNAGGDVMRPFGEAGSLPMLDNEIGDLAAFYEGVGKDCAAVGDVDGLVFVAANLTALRSAVEGALAYRTAAHPPYGAHAGYTEAALHLAFPEAF